VLAKLAQPIAGNELCGRSGKDDLAAVPARGDACGEVDVISDVSLLGQERRPGVQADPHLNRPGGERLGELPCRCQRSLRRREGDEEGVALRVDLDAAVAGEGLAQRAPVLRERLRIALCSQLVQELGRALHVGEEEGDRPGREVTPHVVIMHLRLQGCHPLDDGGAGELAKRIEPARRRRSGHRVTVASTTGCAPFSQRRRSKAAAKSSM
jgi:hypothetical protein